MKQSVCVALAAWILLSGCGGKKRPAKVTAARLGSTESGIASWYGHPYHGRRAANGEVYDMEKMTAAHRTLPFGTWVQVRNLSNDSTVNVRITDRGPFVKGRVIDLSHAAAVSIAMVGPGTAKVKFTVISAPQTAPPEISLPPSVKPPPVPSVQPASGEFGVQVGSFTERRNAERVRTAMERRYASARIVMRDAQPPQWRVVVGREATEAGAAELAERIRSDAQAAVADAFVVRLDGEGAADSI